MNVYISGVGMTAFGRHVDRSVKDLTREAVNAALLDAGIERSLIEAAWFSNTRQQILEGQNTIRGQCALRAMGFQSIPIVNIENACASGSSALREAIAHILAGFCDIALVVGAEKMYFPDNEEGMYRAFMGGTDIYTIQETAKRLESVGAGIGPTHDDPQANVRRHSFFMDSYAAFARLHMKTFGTTQEQIAAVAAKNHNHSQHNPLSQYRFPMSIEQVLADRPVAWPLTRSMCAPISDGAAAIVVCSERATRRFQRNRCLKIAASVLVSGTDRRPDAFDQHIGRIAALKAYEQAGMTPGDIDVAEVHDATAYSEIQQIENLGFCAIGEGGPFALSGATSIGGRIPVNVSGGLISKGHPVGATGISQLCELASQLRGEAGVRQVEGARTAIAENGGGFLHVEEAATVCTILTR